MSIIPNPTKQIYAILFIGLSFLGCLGAVVYLIYELQVQSANAATEKAARKISDANYTGLDDELKRIKNELNQLRDRNKALERDIETSKKTISRLSSDRNKALERIKVMKVPEGCEDQFEWLRQRALEIER